MKQLKTVISFLFAAVIFAAMAVVPASAANSSLYFSSSSVEVGGSLTVSVTIKPGFAIYSTDFSVTYNADVLQYKSSDCTVNASGAGVIKVAQGENGGTSITHQFTFTAKSAGSSTISASGAAYGEDEDVSFGSSASITVKDVSKSDNANLKSLSLSAGSLSPSFSVPRTTYTASVPNSCEECKVYATAADRDAKVSVSGNSALSVGKNIRTITVTAANGNQKIYTITITRRAEDPEETTSDAAPEEPENNTPSVTLNGVTYTLATDLTDVHLPSGFLSAEVEYNGLPVVVAQDQDHLYTLYYLKAASHTEDADSQPDASSETGETADEPPVDDYAPYLLTEDGSFEKLLYLSFETRDYIPAPLPQAYSMPSQYYPVSLTVQGQTFTAYATNSDGERDFYYLYCFHNNAYGFYRYDAKEETLQRFPSLTLMQGDSSENIYADMSFWARFRSLADNAKRVVLGLLVLCLAVIVLIVWAIVRAVAIRKRANLEQENLGDLFDDKFDDILIEDETAPTDENNDSDNFFLE